MSMYKNLLQAVFGQQSPECKVQRFDIAKLRIEVGTLVLLEVIAIASQRAGILQLTHAHENAVLFTLSIYCCAKKISLRKRVTGLSCNESIGCSTLQTFQMVGIIT